MLTHKESDKEAKRNHKIKKQPNNPANLNRRFEVFSVCFYA
jgi:hypothetical protein